jgi:hypothetical protein
MARMLKARTVSMVPPLLLLVQPRCANAQMSSVSRAGNGAAPDGALAAGLRSSSFQNKLAEKIYRLIAPRSGQFDLQILRLQESNGREQV